LNNSQIEHETHLSLRLLIVSSMPKEKSLHALSASMLRMLVRLSTLVPREKSCVLCVQYSDERQHNFFIYSAPRKVDDSSHVTFCSASVHIMALLDASLSPLSASVKTNALGSLIDTSTRRSSPCSIKYGDNKAQKKNCIYCFPIWYVLLFDEDNAWHCILHYTLLIGAFSLFERERERERESQHVAADHSCTSFIF